MINFRPKAKVSKKPAKKRKVSSRVVRKPSSKPGEGFTPEDIAEMNMFALAAARSVVAAHEREKAQARKRAK